jgi:hypothetical protein
MALAADAEALPVLLEASGLHQVAQCALELVLLSGIVCACAEQLLHAYKAAGAADQLHQLLFIYGQGDLERSRGEPTRAALRKSHLVEKTRPAPPVRRGRRWPGCAHRRRRGRKSDDRQK